jgi:hypothetical protein
VGGLQLYDEANLLSREEALRLYTRGSSWFSSEEDRKGAIAPGHLADLSALSADYFAVSDEEVKGIESVLTIAGGKVVHGAAEFAELAPPPPPVSPDWSPVRYYGGYQTANPVAAGVTRSGVHSCGPRFELWPGWTGCDCFAF